VTPEEAIDEAKRGALRPVYLLTGEEHFLRAEVLSAIRAAAIGAGVAAFNEDRFTAGEVDVMKVIAAARTVPMMSPRRFVLVANVDRWEGAEGDTAPLDKLADYAAAPIAETCLVMTASKLDGRRKLATTARKQGFVVECTELPRRELPHWIKGRAKALGNAIDHEVADLLAELAGPELGSVNDALERLSLYVGGGGAITEQAVSECVARVRAADTWAVVDAVRARDLSKGLRALSEAYDPRDRGLVLLGALAWSIRQLARYQAETIAGASPDQAAQRAGVAPGFRARELGKLANSVSAKDVERWMLVLAETDVALKGSKRPPEAVLEEMLTRLCAQRSPRPATARR
jgi:DNA polymerase-3 subunit delta